MLARIRRSGAVRAATLALATCSLAERGFAQHQHAHPPAPEPITAREPAPLESERMEHRGDAHEEHVLKALLGPYPPEREASGTSWVPDTSPMHGLHFAHGQWHGMLHGYATLVHDHQGGPRGDEELFSANMLMAQGSHPL